VHEPELDELDAATLSARHIGAKPPIVQDFRDEDALATYPRLIAAAERRDRHACAALLQLSGARSQLRTKSSADRRRRG
jgi:asparagine synthase (glutamine-hydrolysing)